MSTKTGIPAEVSLYHPAEFLELNKTTLAFLNLALQEFKGGITHQLLMGHIVHYVQTNGLEDLQTKPHYREVYMEDLIRQSLEKGIDMKNLKQYKFNISWGKLSTLSDSTSIYQPNDEFAKLSNIFYSSNYPMFHRLPFNRKISWKHVRSLVDSMKRNGITSHPLVVYTDCIDGEWKYWIVDGQHRVEAFKKLGLPIQFTLYKKANSEPITIYDLVRLVADVNNNSKKWDLPTYLKAWSFIKVREYVKLEEVQKRTKITLTSLLQAYSGLHRRQATERFTAGTYRMDKETDGDRYVEYLVELKPLLPKSTALYTSLLDFFREKPDYNNGRLVSAIKLSEGKMYFGEKQEEIIATLQDLYAKAA